MALTERKGDFDNQTRSCAYDGHLGGKLWRFETGEAVAVVVVVVGDDDLWVV